MTNEIMNNEIIETEEMGIQETPESSGSGIVGKLAVGAVIVGAGVAAFLYKTRAKREERKIEKLRKKGYVITRESEQADKVVEVSGEVVETEEVE
jgi:hypothetical protein